MFLFDIGGLPSEAPSLTGSAPQIDDDDDDDLVKVCSGPDTKSIGLSCEGHIATVEVAVQKRLCPVTWQVLTSILPTGACSLSALACLSNCTGCAPELMG